MQVLRLNQCQRGYSVLAFGGLYSSNWGGAPALPQTDISYFGLPKPTSTGARPGSFQSKAVSTPTENPRDAVVRLFALYHKHGHEDYIGEPVSQLEHMRQAAALAEAEGFEEEVILAAFFHDLGHLCAHPDEVESMDGFGVVNHEKLGADYLRRCGFSERMARLVESHVQAKRYLTFKHPEYFRQLSPASRATLAFQGGVMTTAEAVAFERHPDAALIIRMRQWDDLAKQEGLPTSSLTPLKNMALRHLQRQKP